MITSTERGAPRHFDSIKARAEAARRLPAEADRHFKVDAASGMAVQGTSDQVELFCQAAVVRTRVTALMKKFAGKKLHQGAKLKRNLRISEKAFLRPATDEGNPNRTLDIVRDMYEAESMEEAAAIVNALCNWQAIPCNLTYTTPDRQRAVQLAGVLLGTS